MVWLPFQKEDLETRVQMDFSLSLHVLIFIIEEKRKRSRKRPAKVKDIALWGILDLGPSPMWFPVCLYHTWLGWDVVELRYL